MRRYDSYKDSGVEWIGEIPSHWKKGKLKHYFNLSSGKNPSDFDKDLGGFPVYGSNGIIGYTNNPDLLKETILIGRVGSSGELNLNQYPCSVSDNCLIVDLIGDTDLKFVYYLLLKSELKNYTTKTSQPLITGSTIREIETVILPYNEQEQIVSFLDIKTSLIDSLIEKTQLKIELLKENRTSLINEVVTKGLNPNVEMKDSGVEWIGEIPSHWEVTILKHLVKENELSLSNNTDPNFELNYIEISDVTSDGRITNSTPYQFKDSPSRCRRIVRKGDVIVSTVRTYLRSIGIIEDEVEDLICSTGFSVLTPNEDILPKFLFYLVRTEWFISDVISKSEGVSYPSIQSEKLRNIRTLYVPHSEQNEIVSYLDEQTGLIDKTISVEERRIELLKEYRQSLISEVVTGKRKVVTHE
jgi:type I restriction enzyme S subunit